MRNLKGVHHGNVKVFPSNLFSNNFRFGAFEEFKKRVVGPDGVLKPHQKLGCGLGMRD